MTIKRLMINLLDFKVEQILVPDYLYDGFKNFTPFTDVVAYCASDLFEIKPNSTVVVHKGLMNRIDITLLNNVNQLFQPVYADDVFVVYQYLGEVNEVPKDIALHVKPVDNYCKSWQPVVVGNSRQRAVIVSAWNVGNVGDDAVTIAADRMCRKIGFREVEYLGPNGDYSKIDTADLLVVGGGGLFYDSSIENASNYTAPIVYAANKGIPVAVMGVGTQGIDTAQGVSAFTKATTLSDLMTVRDQADVEVMGKITQYNVTMTADLAWSLHDLQRHSVKNSFAKVAIISLNEMLDEAGQVLQPNFSRDVIVELVNKLKSTGHHVLLARHSIDDKDLYERVVALTGVQHIDLSQIGIKAALDLYASAELAITSRFHGIVFGAIAQTKLAVVCHHKGKLGNIIHDKLKSLESHATFLPLTKTVDEIISSSRMVDRKEVNTQCQAAARTMQLLELMLMNKRGTQVSISAF